MAKKTDILQIKLTTTGAGKTKAEVVSVADGLNTVDNSAKTANKSLLSLKSLLGGIAFAAVAKGLFNANVEYQKLQASLKTVTGSQAEANKEWANLEQFAKTTPFQLNQVVDSFIKLKALGLDPSMKALASYGNTASAMGKDLNQFIEAVADASTGEFERLKEFGIKAKQQGDEVSFTFQGVTTTVKKNAADIEGYLRTLGDTTFAGAMAEQMDTLGGAVSNLEDAFGGLARQIGDSGFNDAMKSLITNMTELVTAISGAPRGLKEIQQELDSLEKRRFGRSANASVQPRRNALLAERDISLSALPGIDGIRAQLQISEDDISGTLQSIDLIKQKIAEIPEDEQVSKTGGGRSRRLTIFGKLEKELKDAETALPELMEKRDSLFEQLFNGSADDEGADASLFGSTGDSSSGGNKNADDEPVNFFTQLTDQEMDDQLSAAIEAEEKLTADFQANALARANAEKQANAIIMNARLNAVQQGVNLLQVFAGKSKIAAIASIALSKGLAIAQSLAANEIAAQAAGARMALAAPPGAGVAAYAAAYAKVKSAGALSVGLIAATGIAQAANVGGGGGGIGGTGGGALPGTPANPITTTNNNDFSNDTSGPSKSTNIYFQFEGFASEEMVELIVLPKLQDLITDNDIILISEGSRQQQELKP